IGAPQRLRHVAGHRAGDQQQIGMARRGDEAQTEALEVIEWIAEGVDLELASVARAGIDLADRQTAAETLLRQCFDLAGEFPERRIARARPLHRARTAQQVFSDDFPHGDASSRNRGTLMYVPSQTDHSSPTQWGRLGRGRGIDAYRPVCGEVPTLVLLHAV